MGVVQSDTQPDTQASCRRHKHEHRLDEDEIKPRHWFTRTGLANGRRARLHTALPMMVSSSVHAVTSNSSSGKPSREMTSEW
jgi:hypothetical protein